MVAPNGLDHGGHLLALAKDAALPEAARQSIQLLADQFRDTPAQPDVSNFRKARDFVASC